MGKRGVAIAILVISLLGMAVGMPLMYVSDAYVDYEYSGKEVFNTEQEYTAFKTELGRDDVQIWSISSLSSSPPIIVEFIAHVDGELEYRLPYGTERKTVGAWPLLFMLAASAVAAAAYITGRELEEG